VNLSAHILSYEWRDFDPVLVAYDGSDVVEIHLADAERVDMQVGKDLTCVGRLEDGEYTPCPNSAPLTGSWRQCPDCARPYIPDLSCVFEPKCDGSLCGVEFCSRPHVVYLAMTGNLMKVGMTSAKRERQRLIEQGADIYAIIYHAKNRLDARQEEKRVSAISGISQAHSRKNKLAQMRKRPDYEAMKVKMSSVLFDIMDHSNPPPEFHILDSYPLELPLRRVPLLRATPGRHTGKVLGFKGRFMLYESHGIYAVDMGEIVGRRVKLSVKFK